MTDYTYFSYTLTPLSRVSVGRGDEVRFLKRMQDIVRGSVIRGALGAAWWSHLDPGHKVIPNGEMQQAFDDLFAKSMHIRQAVPRRGDKEAEFMPVSTLLCKYRSSPGCRDFRFDAASEADEPELCPGCGGNLRYGKGWSIPSDWSTNVTTTALTERGVALEQNLFSREVFKEGITFHGTLRINRDSSYYDMAAKWITVKDRRISIGGKKSVLGRVEWIANKMESPPSEITPPSNSNLVALYLKSPAILVDEFGFPELNLKKWLSDPDRAPDQGRVDATWTRPATESGWNSIARMPKPTEWTLAAGSTALLHGWNLEALRNIGQGIGLRQNEGFGEVELVHSNALEREV